VPSSSSAKSRLREFLLANVGTVVTKEQLQEAAGPNVTEWARRVRELRDEEGWPILTNNDSTSLKPGQYLLREYPTRQNDVNFSRSISLKLRAEVLDRNGFTCQMCGATPGETDSETGRKVRLHIGHIVDKSLGGRDELSNLRTLCSSCNQGAKNITTERPTANWLLAQTRRAGLDEQKVVFEWLRTKFDT
jgi:hypothetical protein